MRCPIAVALMSKPHKTQRWIWKANSYRLGHFSELSLEKSFVPLPVKLFHKFSVFCLLLWSLFFPSLHLILLVTGSNETKKNVIYKMATSRNSYKCLSHFWNWCILTFHSRTSVWKSDNFRFIWIKTGQSFSTPWPEPIPHITVWKDQSPFSMHNFLSLVPDHWRICVITRELWDHFSSSVFPQNWPVQVQSSKAEAEEMGKRCLHQHSALNIKSAVLSLISGWHNWALGNRYVHTLWAQRDCFFLQN